MSQYKRFSAGLLLAALAVFASFANAQPAQRGAPAHVRQAFLERFDGARLQRLRTAIKAQNRHSAALMQRAGVVGTSVGWDTDDQTVVKIYTELNASAAGLPETVDGIRVVVEQTGKIYAQNVPCEQRDNCGEPPLVVPNSAEPPNQRDWHPRPVPIGVSSGRNGGSGGTLGCRLSGSSGCHSYTYALSNRHVYGSLLGTTILQPGVTDGGIDPDDSIGSLAATVPIIMSTSLSTQNRVDAAIAITNISEVGTTTRTDGYGMPKTATLEPVVGMDVMKYGRSSAQTYGYIDAINAVVNVQYGSATARFVDQIIIKTNDGSAFVIGGDSGSLVVASGGADDRKPVGLVFASGAGITVANEINDVLELLDAEIGLELRIDGEL